MEKISEERDEELSKRGDVIKDAIVEALTEVYGEQAKHIGFFTFHYDFRSEDGAVGTITNGNIDDMIVVMKNFIKSFQQ